jgi:hypothetical protein
VPAGSGSNRIGVDQNPTTLTGVELIAAADPMPRLPWKLLPQHRISPVFRSAHEWLLPRLSLTTPEDPRGGVIPSTQTAEAL